MGRLAADDLDEFGAKLMGSATTAAETLLREFDSAWRDDTPVFGCCRKAVHTAVGHVDLVSVAALDVTDRVQALRNATEAEHPGHLETHRCCANHLADLAFDLPDLMTFPSGEAE